METNNNNTLVDTDVYEEKVIDQERYITLVNMIFNNAKLNWKGTGLAINDNEGDFEYLKAIEPSMYEAKMKELQEIETKDEQNNKTI